MATDNEPADASKSKRLTRQVKEDSQAKALAKGASDQLDCVPLYIDEEEDKILSSVEADHAAKTNARASPRVPMTGVTAKTNTHPDSGNSSTDEKLKKIARQENRRLRILARTSEEDSKLPSDSVTSTDEKLKKGTRQENRRGRILSRALEEDSKPPRVPPNHEAEQYDEEKVEEDDVTPGAVRVSGGMHTTSTGLGDEEDGLNNISTGGDDEEDGLEQNPAEDHSTVIGATDLQCQMNKEESICNILEAQLVDEDEREKMERELRQKLQGELGQVAQAEVMVDDGSNTRRRALLGIGILVSLVAIIIGCVLAMRDTSPNTVSVPETTAPTISSLRPSPSQTPAATPTPLNDNLCVEGHPVQAHPIVLGANAIVASLENATEVRSVVFCEFPDQTAEFQPGLWYKYIGQDKSVIAQASGGVDLQVYPECDQTTCDIPDVFYGNSTVSSTVAWKAVSGVAYMLLVTSKALSSSTSIPEFELQIFDQDSCDGAFLIGPIIPGVGKRLLGSTLNGATVDTQAPSCGSASSPTVPGVWYTIIGDGGAITASTCTGTDFDSQLSVFTGSSCGQLTCVDGNNDACSSQSRVEFQSNQDQIYYLLVHGFGGAYGNFALSIATRLTPLFELFVDYNVSIQALQDLSSPQYEALDWMTNDDSTDLQDTMSDDELVQRFALILVYAAMGGGYWLNLPPCSVDTCSWNQIVNGYTIGVGCNDEGSAVTLFLSANGSSGSVPTEIGLLSDLVDLQLGDNRLTGTVPSQLGSLSSLQRLSLDNNKLSGPIPSELSQISTLQVLRLGSNALTGTVPSELGRLQSLSDLRIDNNQLTGSVPSQLGTLSSLVELDLGDNDLTGRIPSELGQISTQQFLFLQSNALTGTIPSELGLLQDLLQLRFNMNQLTGSVPTQLGQMSSLEYLGLYENKLTGSIPSELGQIAALQELNLLWNALTGQMPTELGHVPRVFF